MCLFGQHKATRARKGIEGRFREGCELKFTIPISEKGEHEKAEPIWSFLVESSKNARLVNITRAALEQPFRFFAPVTAEMGVQ